MTNDNQTAEQRFEAVAEEAIFIGIMKLKLSPEIVRGVMLRKLDEQYPNTPT